MCGELLNRRAGNDERTRGEHPPEANGKLCVGRMSAQILSPQVFAGEGCSAPAAPATPSMGVPMAAVEDLAGVKIINRCSFSLFLPCARTSGRRKTQRQACQLHGEYDNTAQTLRGMRHRRRPRRAE